MLRFKLEFSREYFDGVALPADSMVEACCDQQFGPAGSLTLHGGMKKTILRVEFKSRMTVEDDIKTDR